MKVLHLSKSDKIGGAFVATYRIHQALRKKNVESYMWVDQKRTNDKTIISQKENFLKQKFKSYRLFLTQVFLKLINRENKVLHSLLIYPSNWVKKINESDADIINLHWIQGEMMSIKDIAKINKPVVWTFHDMWPFCGSEHIAKHNRWIKGYNISDKSRSKFKLDISCWNWNRKKKYWKKPIQIITPSSWLTDCVKKSKLMKTWPVSTIPNTIDTTNWKLLNKKKSRKKLNLSTNKTLLLFGAVDGTNDPNKGFNLFCKALKVLSKKNYNKENLQIIIFGKINLNDMPVIEYPVHYTGYIISQKKLNLLYSAADVMIHPSKTESFGLTALEAHACGTPVVAFNTTGLKDIIKHKETGYLAKPFDHKDLSKGIRWAIHNNKKNVLSKKARNTVVKNFSYSLVSKKYFSLYKRTLIRYKKPNLN